MELILEITLEAIRGLKPPAENSAATRRIRSTQCRCLR